ncbi:MAG: CHAP domain-containing protein [Candidatus Nanopelagicales bacterium]|nr:CHAP domain-containing protein [Candidatus Nanopelagicales bacterium]
MRGDRYNPKGVPWRLLPLAVIGLLLWSSTPLAPANGVTTSSDRPAAPTAAATSSIAPTPAPSASATPAAAATPAFPTEGTVLVSGGAWLQGAGVDVVSSGGPGGDGLRQCGELAARLYRAKGWPLVNAAGNGGAAYLPEGSPGLEAHAPGSGYEPAPGDLVIEGPTSGNPFGHVAVVDSVHGRVLAAVEQNASRTGRHEYAIDAAGMVTGGYGPVTAILHAPANRLRSTQLKLVQGTKSTAAAGWVTQAPIRHVFSIRNAGRQSAVIRSLALGVIDQAGVRRHLVCALDFTLRPGQSRTCQVSAAWEAPGQYRVWADWMDARGNWHAGSLGSQRTFTLHDVSAEVQAEPAAQAIEAAVDTATAAEPSSQ